MRYKDLTIHQRIGLKGFFETDPVLIKYWAVMKLFGFVPAVDYFLTDDIDILTELMIHKRDNDYFIEYFNTYTKEYYDKTKDFR